MQNHWMDGAGNPVDLETYVHALNTYKQWKNETASGMRSNPWSPAGPFAAPTPSSDNIFTGTGRINTITFHPTDKTDVAEIEQDIILSDYSDNLVLEQDTQEVTE